MFFMKNKTMALFVQRLGFVALIAVIGFSFVACGDGNDPDGGGTGGDGTDGDGTAPKITTTSLPGGTVGTAYSQTLEATGDTPVTWSLAGGALPAGLNLAETTGTITGTPTAARTSTFTVRATNAAGSDTKSLSITIAAAGGGGGGTAPRITTASLQGGTVGTAYSQTLAATGDSPINWNVSAGTLPTGLTLQSDTISGTPTAAGTSAFTVRAANAAGNDTKSLSITITGGGNQEPEIEGMVWIQGGTFTMGSPEEESAHNSDETQHQVTLTGFYMGKYQVTQAQYQEVMGINPSYFRTAVSPETSTAKRPVERVCWYDALVFCNKLSISEGLTPAYSIGGKTDPEEWGTVPTSENPTWNAVTVVAGSDGYRLPTEAQWEYACRAGTTGPFNTGDNITTAQANYDGTLPYNNNPAGIYRNRTTEVGSFEPNAWGLYDMHGNVWEWCWDWYGGPYASGTQTDPTGAGSGYNRVMRGGSWFTFGRNLRSAFRYYEEPYGWFEYSEIGFRVVRPNTNEE
jgi:formylglycine-generating enzyme required for sulfatase activity